MTQARTVVVLLTMAAGAAVSAAQQRPVFRAGVETVQVDVVVRDRNSNPVHDLTADDFIVLDRGKPQQVVAFKAVRREDHETPSFASRFPLATRADVASNQTAEARRLVVLVLDDLHGYRGRDEVVKKIARGVVEQLGSDALMALLVTSGDYNVAITDDRSRVLTGIDRFKGARAVRRPMQAREDRRGGADLQEFDANLRMYGTLEQAARLFSAADGRRKAFILVSENLAKDLAGVLQSQQAQPDLESLVSGAEAYASGNLEVRPRLNPTHHDDAVLAAMRSLRKSNVVTYAVDPRGAISARDMLLECQPAFGMGVDPCAGDETPGGPPSMNSWVRLAQQGLQQIAEASGGLAIVNSSDFSGGVARIADDLDNYYLLGFDPEDTRTPGLRRLEVRVKNRPDLQLRYRRDYEIGGKAASAPKNALLELASGPVPRNGVPLRLTAAALPGKGKDARIHVVLEVAAPRQLLEEPDAWIRDRIQYSLAVIGVHGSKVKDVMAYGGAVAFRPNETTGAVARYHVALELALAPGRYQLRAAASSAKLDNGGSVYFPLDVPDFTKAGFALTTPLVGYGSGSRVPTFVRLPAPARGSAAPPAPFGLPLAPTLDREFRATDDVVLYFEVIRRDRAREITAELLVVDGGDGVVHRYAEKIPATSAGKVSVRLPLKQIGAGAFRLRIRASDGVNETTNEVPIIVR